jgi:hypothetical protein
MDLKKKSTYMSLQKSYEEYTPPVTMSYSDWIHYVENGENTLYGDALRPSSTMNGAVYTGHVRQNPWTAGNTTPKK